VRPKNRLDQTGRSVSTSVNAVSMIDSVGLQIDGLLREAAIGCLMQNLRFYDGGCQGGGYVAILKSSTTK